MKTNDGGPAFPTIMPGFAHSGMSLRDWFAGMALQGLAHWRELREIESQKDVVSTAYSVADAMLAERNK